MRKYRFASTNSKWNSIKPKLNTLYFILAWNFAGYAIYKGLKYNAGQNIHGFDRLSDAEKHMHIMGCKPTQKVTIRGLKVEKVETYQAFEAKPKTEAT